MVVKSSCFLPHSLSHRTPINPARIPIATYFFSDDTLKKGGFDRKKYDEGMGGENTFHLPGRYHLIMGKIRL
jgi:hypothetical protein